MSQRTRREMLSDVGKGMFVASLGTGLAADLGFGTAWAAEEAGRLTFGDLEPLVEFIASTPADKLLPKVVEKLNAGTELRQLVSAASLANARAFGGEDYVGFHTLMALPPAYHMAMEETDAKRRPLAVLKVLYRNATRLGEVGAPATEVLKPVTPGDGQEGHGRKVRDQVRAKDVDAAERTFAAMAKGPPQDLLDAVMETVDDGVEVHRTVLVARSWELLDFVGKELAHTLLRQSVRYCAKLEKNDGYVKGHQGIRELLPKLLDEKKLLARKPGTKAMDEAWVSAFADTLFAGTPDQAADAVASALAEGVSTTSIGDAISLAANQLVLRDEGRPEKWSTPAKPAGSCHGDSIGVHACDSMLAWRAIARVGNWRTTATSLILAGYQVARDRGGRAEFTKWVPYPRPEHLEKVSGLAADALLKELDGAVREKDQPRACALTQRIAGESMYSPKDVFALLRKYAVSEDGALHAEKFYRTTTEEFAGTRPAFRWRQLVALAKVTASACGQPAPGMQQARELMKV